MDAKAPYQAPYQPPCTEAEFKQAMRCIEAQKLVTAMEANEQGIFVLREDDSEGAAEFADLVHEAVTMGLMRRTTFFGKDAFALA